MKKYIFNLILLIVFIALYFTTQLIYAQNNNKGKWVLIKTNVFLPKPTNDNVWEVSVTGGSGSFNYQDHCKTYSGKFRTNGTFTYSPPPATLTPGVKTELSASVNVTFVKPEKELWWNPGMDGIIWESPLGTDTSKMYFTFSYKTLLFLTVNEKNTSASGKAIINPPEGKGKNFYKIRAGAHGGGVAEYIYEWKQDYNNENEVITNNENNNNENENENNNENINNNENENTQNSELVINLYNQTPSTIYSSPGDRNTCNLQADVSCSIPADKTGRTIKVEVLNGQKGTFNTTTALTDANGKAYFTYTAPDESALNGKNEIKIQVKATDVKSGEFSVIPITILNRNIKSGFFAQHIIMPQGKEFYNELTIFINAPPKGDGYQATITTKDALGLITSSKTNPGGESPVSIKIKPGKEYKLYYHNTGVITQTQPIDEEVTLEIPELNFKQTINISVGLDLMVQSVERKYKTGTIFPALPEPLEISITDNFHPDADLEKIFDDFDIIMRVRIKPEKISQSSVMSKYEEDWMSRALTKFEGFMLGGDIVSSSGDAIVTPKKSKDGKYLICQNNREALPFVIMFDRGTFDFKVELIDINFSEEHSNNSGTISFTVEAYRNEADEVLKTVLIPMSKVIFDKISGGLLSYADVVSASTDAVMYKDAIKKGKLDEAVIGLFSIACSRVEKANKFYNFVTKVYDPLTERTKRLLSLVEVATNTLLIAKIDANENPKNEGGGKNSSFKDISERLKYSQLILKGMKNYYFVMMDKSGLKNYSATLKGGNKLLPSNDKVLKANSTEERIENDNDFVIIPLENSEEINLNLDFNGTAGFLYRVTKDKIDKITYPQNSSNTSISINNNNVLTIGKQEAKTNEKEKKSNLFSGSWETADFGTVSFIISGSDVIATCTKNLTGMKGTLSSDGTKITGTWAKFPTYSSPNDAGKFEVTVSSDGKSFTGKWGKGTDSNSKLTNNLNGKKK